MLEDRTAAICGACDSVILVVDLPPHPLDLVLSETFSACWTDHKSVPNPSKAIEHRACAPISTQYIPDKTVNKVI